MCPDEKIRQDIIFTATYFPVPNESPPGQKQSWPRDFAHCETELVNDIIQCLKG